MNRFKLIVYWGNDDVPDTYHMNYDLSDIVCSKDNRHNKILFSAVKDGLVILVSTHGYSNNVGTFLPMTRDPRNKRNLVPNSVPRKIPVHDIHDLYRIIVKNFEVSISIPLNDDRSKIDNSRSDTLKIFDKLPQGTSISNVVTGTINYYDAHGSNRHVPVRPVFDTVDKLNKEIYDLLETIKAQRIRIEELETT